MQIFSLKNFQYKFFSLHFLWIFFFFFATRKKTFKHNLLNENCFLCFSSQVTFNFYLSVHLSCLHFSNKRIEKKYNVRASVYVEWNCIACMYTEKKFNRFSHQHWGSVGNFFIALYAADFFFFFFLYVAFRNMIGGMMRRLCQNFGI